MICKIGQRHNWEKQVSKVIADQETIDWIAVATRLPDDDELVLTNVPECGEPVWIGWYEGETGTWFQADGGEIAFPVLYWAAMPRGASTSAKT